MIRHHGLALFLGIIGFSLPVDGVAWAQDVRQLSVGVSAGGGGVQPRFRDSSWDFGPFFGGRVEWGTRRSAAVMRFDLQPFPARGNDAIGEYRAAYLMPSYAVGTSRRRVGFGLGLGLFDFTSSPVADDGLEVGFVTGAHGSLRIAGSYSVELGWKRINNVKGLVANVWSLQLVRRWRL